MITDWDVVNRFRRGGEDLRSANLETYAKRGEQILISCHVPIGVKLSQERNLTGKDDLVLMNADNISSTTRRHQYMMRTVCRGPDMSFLGIHFVKSRHTRDRSYRDVVIIDYDDGDQIPIGSLPSEETKKKLLGEGYTIYRIGRDMWYAHRAGSVLFELKLDPESQFLWSFDRENGKYFVAKLPKRVLKISEAKKALVPSAVQRAYNDGIPTLRQGEWYFILVDKSFLPRRIKWDKYAYLPTASYQRDPHYRVTRMALVDGRILVKGTVRHSNKDHRMLRLRYESIKCGAEIWEAHLSPIMWEWSAKQEGID